MAGHNSFKIFSSFRIGTQELIRDTIEFLNSEFNQHRTLFTVASPYGQILYVIENLAQLIFYYIEDSITELNIYQATRNSSIYSLSALTGHDPTRSIGAVGEINLQTKSEDEQAIPQGKVIIPNYTRINCENNDHTYSIQLSTDEITFKLNETRHSPINIKQGHIETQTFTARGEPLESFNINFPSNFFIDHFDIHVYVNDELWRQENHLFDMPMQSKTYMAKTSSGINGVDIFFGNENNGKVLNLGDTVKVEYLVTNGFGGNIHTTDPSQINYTFIDTGFNILGEEIDLNEVIRIDSEVPPNFGANSEDTELTRMVAPHASKSFALVNESHYETFLRKLQAFSIIRVFQDDKDENKLNLFLIPDINKFVKKGEDYFNLEEIRFYLQDSKKNKILQYITKRGTEVISTETRIIDPIISRYVINISINVYREPSTDIIKSNIVDKVGEYFIDNERRDRIPRSDIINRIKTIEGVDSVAVNIISEKNEIRKREEGEDSPDIGIDEFGDIIIQKNELPIIRGGWKDRFGNKYEKGLTDEGLGAVNIQIKNILRSS
jgi:hypothetical protein